MVITEIGVYATNTTMSSSAVGYDKTNSEVNGATKDTVQEAIDELYSMTIPGTLTLDTTNGTEVAITKGFYDKVNTTALYNAGLAAGKTTHTETYTFAANDTGGTKDLGTNHTYRYVNATNVYNKGKADGQAIPKTVTLYIAISDNYGWVSTDSDGGNLLWEGILGFGKRGTFNVTIK